jgi:hypothetical protein
MGNFTLQNPYLQEWKEQHALQVKREAALIEALSRQDMASVKDILTFRRSMVHRYAWAIPTAEAIRAVVNGHPILEIGGGTGYWCWLIRQMSGDILTVDVSPPASDCEQNIFHTRSKTWTEVIQGDETLVDEHPSRTLFLCWPPWQNSLASAALRRYRGQWLIFVGEFPTPGRPLVTGDEAFFQMVLTEWHLLTSIAIPCWELCSDRLWIFQRRPV